MLSLWLATTGIVAQANLVSAANDALDQFEGVAVLGDRQGQWTIDQVRGAGLDSQFKPWPTQQGQINLGFSDSIYYWVRIALKRQPEAATRWVLELPYFQLNTIDFLPRVKRLPKPDRLGPCRAGLICTASSPLQSTWGWSASTTTCGSAASTA